MSKNLFYSDSIESKMSRIVYDKLMTREPIGFADVLREYYRTNCPKEKIEDRDKLEFKPHYTSLKKVFPKVIKMLRGKDANCIEKLKVGPRICFRYVGTDSNPLMEEVSVAEKKSLHDYMDFCINAAGLLPDGWFSKYFKGTYDLVEVNNQASQGSYHISCGNNFVLRNIHLLPMFNDAIIDKKVLQLTYKPFTENVRTVVFHPQFMKEYNGRWFIFGEADCEPYHAVNIALDRIEGDVLKLPNVEYIPAEKGFYNNYFSNIVGVTHLKDFQAEKVTFRTTNKYMHNLIGAKKFHHSLKEVLPFTKHNDGNYGEYELFVEQNDELTSRLLSFGSGIEVIAPVSLRNSLRKAINKMLKHYDKRYI